MPSPQVGGRTLGGSPPLVPDSWSYFFLLLKCLQGDWRWGGRCCGCWASQLFGWGEMDGAGSSRGAAVGDALLPAFPGQGCQPQPRSRELHMPASSSPPSTPLVFPCSPPPPPTLPHPTPPLPTGLQSAAWAPSSSCWACLLTCCTRACSSGRASRRWIASRPMTTQCWWLRTWLREGWTSRTCGESSGWGLV